MNDDWPNAHPPTAPPPPPPPDPSPATGGPSAGPGGGSSAEPPVPADAAAGTGAAAPTAGPSWQNPGVVGWVGLGLSAVLLVALLAVGVGASSASSDADATQAELEGRVDALEDDNASLAAQVDELEAERDDLTARLAAARGDVDERDDRIAELTAEVPAPDLAGRELAAVEAVAEENGWELDVVEEETADAPVGTVIRQEPAPGTVMSLGATLRVFVAKEPPPAPPSWQTVFSQSGVGTLKTAPFTIPPVPGGNAKLVYSFSGDSNDVVRLVPASSSGFGDLLVNEIGPVSGETFLYESGTFYLDITGPQWSVSVQVLQ